MFFAQDKYLNLFFVYLLVVYAFISTFIYLGTTIAVCISNAYIDLN